MQQTIWLLTHETELHKPTNTGQVVVDMFDTIANATNINVRVVVWSRVNMDPSLLQALKDPCLLVYPAEDAISLDVSRFDKHLLEGNVNEEDESLLQLDFSQFKHLMLLDATWQLARKMYNQSPYLKTLPKIQLVGAAPSTYSLRRNQLQIGWCTAEVVIMLLTLIKKPNAARLLQEQYAVFNRRG